jgi:hypothetical protein
MKRLWMLIALAVMTLPPAALAATTDARTAPVLTTPTLTAGSPPVPSQFRGAPLSQCENFMITEWGLSNYMQGGPKDFRAWYVTGEIGMMHNRTPHSAVGVTVFVGFDDQGNREGLKARYRWWLAGQSGQPGPVSVELSAGLLLVGSDSYGYAVGPARDAYGDLEWHERRIQYPSPMASVGLNAGDWISLVSQLEWIRLDRGESELAWTAGLRLGSYAGVVACLATVAVVGVAIRSMSLAFGG